MKAVKNISRLVRVYRVRPGGIAGPSYSAAHWRPRNWRVIAMTAGSVIGLAMVIAVVALLISPLLRKTTTSDAPPASANHGGAILIETLTHMASPYSAVVGCKPLDQFDDAAAELGLLDPHAGHTKGRQFPTEWLLQDTRDQPCAEAGRSITLKEA